MVNQQLLDYIHQQTQLGKNKEEITSALLAAGWKSEDVTQAFAKEGQTSAVPMPVAAEFPKAGKVLSEAWAIYKTRFKTLIAISVIPLLAYVIIGLVVAGGAVILSLLHISVGGLSLIAVVLVAIVFLIAIIYLAVWGSVAGLFAIKDSAEAIGWKESFKRSKPYINPFFSTGLLSGLAVFGGVLLLIIPGIIFALWFSQSPYVVIEEGLQNRAALKRSKYYVKGRLGLIFGKLFYMGIITVGISILIGIVFGLFDSILGIKPAYTSWINNVFSLFWTPLVTVYGYLIYKHAKATRP